MPWTFSHLAAVIPVSKKTRLSLLGLGVGSVVPDFYYYAGSPEKAAEFHTLLGIIYYCLPVGLLLAVTIKLLQPQMSYLLPQEIQAIINIRHKYKILSLGFLGDMAVGVAIGAFTHIVWDSFTHETGFFVKELEWLRIVLFSFAQRDFRGFNVLQHLSTIVGLVYIAKSFHIWIKSNGVALSSSMSSHSEKKKIKIWFFLICFSIIASVLLTSIMFDAGNVKNIRSYFFVQTVFHATFIFIVASVVASFIFYKRIDGESHL